MTNVIPNLHTLGTVQCFPLYTYEKSDSDGLFASDDSYTCQDNIPDSILKQFRDQCGNQTITKEDIFYYAYGLLHSLEYRERFESDLKKMLPRIPFAPDFWAFSKAGRELAHWHVDYEKIEPYPLTIQKHKLTEGEGFYNVTKMKHPAKCGRIDRSVIEYNANIAISGIPEEAHEYIVNGKSALAWVMEHYAVTVDKDSGIKNDPNDWCREHSDPQYILRFIGQVVKVSVETVRIVNSLPGIE